MAININSKIKYRKKPVVIDAVQWTGTNKREMYDFLTMDTFSEEDMQAYKNNFYIDHSKVEGGLIIKTLEGEHLASIGDYIIRGVKGEYYPCKEDIFHQTYEYAEAVEPTPYQHPVTFTQPHTNPNLVPYSTICGCTTCGCTMGNKMINPRFNTLMDSTLPNSK